MSKNDLSDDYLLAIGRIVVSVSKLESAIIDLIRVFMGVRSIINAVTAFSQQQISTNLDTLRALYSVGSLKDELKSDQFLALLDQVKRVAEFRNTVVHGYWIIDENGDALAVRFKGRGTFSRTRKLIKSEEILSQAVEAEQLLQKLRGLRDHLLAENPERFSEDQP